jgi:hypothetical protein
MKIFLWTQQVQQLARYNLVILHEEFWVENMVTNQVFHPAELLLDKTEPFLKV